MLPKILKRHSPASPMRGVCPEQGTSTHLSTCSLGPASSCSLGFSQHRAGLKNGNFCHSRQAHMGPGSSTGKSGKSDECKLFQRPGSHSLGEASAIPVIPVIPALLGHPQAPDKEWYPELPGCTKSPWPAQQTQPWLVFNQPEKSSSRFHAELSIRLQRKHILSLIKNKSGCMETNKRRTA